MLLHYFLQAWRSTCKTLVIVHVSRQVSPDFYLFQNFWKEKKSQVSPIHTTKVFGFWWLYNRWNRKKIFMILLEGGGPTPFLLIPKSWFWCVLEKNGEKSIWKEREKVFVLANCWYFIIIIFGILIIKQDFSCNSLHDLDMTLSS